MSDVSEPIQLPQAAIIGAGFLGARIAAELLLLGSEVTVYDRGLANDSKGQEQLDTQISRVINECDKQGLMTLVEMKPVPPKGPWKPDGEVARQAILCKSLEDAVKSADIVVEAVPDNIDIKKNVFEAALNASPSHALLCTSTLTIPLAVLHERIEKAPRKDNDLLKMRLCGLRFLAPVVFIPFVEITLTNYQIENGVRDLLVSVLQSWGKSAFKCDIQNAVGEGTSMNQRAALGMMRVRLDQESAARRQQAEARLRKAARSGPEALSQLRGRDLFNFGGQDMCCICLESPAAVKSMICGHSCVCEACCNDLLAQAAGSSRHNGEWSGQGWQLLWRGAAPQAEVARCPICRARFVREEFSANQVGGVCLACGGEGCGLCRQRRGSGGYAKMIEL